MTQTISKTKQVELTEKHIEVMENFEKLLESGIANQTMSDIATFEELKGSIKNKKIAWLGDGLSLIHI